MADKDCKITVLTATYNAIGTLPNLVESLENQANKNFKWVVADGGSDDGTVEFLNDIDSLDIKVTQKEDFGVYDALNRGLKEVGTEYYLVVGADDFLFEDAIDNYCSVLDNDSYDLVCCSCDAGGVINKAAKGRAWLYGMRGEASCHSVSTLIKKELHNKNGVYSKKYPICADQLFIGKSIQNGASVGIYDFVAGFYNTSGMSGVEVAGVITENYCVQLDLGHNRFVQTMILFFRLMKNISRI